MWLAGLVRRSPSHGIVVALLVHAAVLLIHADLQADVIRLGGTLSLSGVYQEPSEMIRKGYRLWRQQTNARGGLLGRKVELLIYDDESRPEKVRHYYRKLIEEDRVDLLLSPYGSPLTIAASEVAEDSGFVMVACASAAEAVWQRGTQRLFGVYATASRYFIGLIDLMARHGYRRLAVVHENSPFHSEVASAVQRWAAQFRVKVELVQGFERGTDLTAVVHTLRQRQDTFDGLIVSAYPPDSYRLLTLFDKADYRPPVLGLSIVPTYPDFHVRAGRIAEGVFGPSQWEPDERIPFPGTRNFIRSFQDAFQHLPSYHAGSAYAACEILGRAVKATGSADQNALADVIARLDTVTVIGRFKVDQRGMQIGHRPILIQWQDGRKQIVYPPKMQTAAPRLD